MSIHADTVSRQPLYFIGNQNKTFKVRCIKWTTGNGEILRRILAANDRLIRTFSDFYRLEATRWTVLHQYSVSAFLNLGQLALLSRLRQPWLAGQAEMK
jgi:hypothetical protein